MAQQSMSAQFFKSKKNHRSHWSCWIICSHNEHFSSPSNLSQGRFQNPNTKSQREQKDTGCSVTFTLYLKISEYRMRSKGGEIKSNLNDNCTYTFYRTALVMKPWCWLIMSKTLGLLFISVTVTVTASKHVQYMPLNNA